MPKKIQIVKVALAALFVLAVVIAPGAEARSMKPREVRNMVRHSLADDISVQTTTGGFPLLRGVIKNRERFTSSATRLLLLEDELGERHHIAETEFAEIYINRAPQTRELGDGYGGAYKVH